MSDGAEALVAQARTQIVGTADRMGVSIFTSNAAFLRGAAAQGVWLDAYVHPSVSFRGL
jgi:hypothetical protein